MQFADPRATEALKYARALRAGGYAPYSGFRMGAAVVTDANAVVAVARRLLARGGDLRGKTSARRHSSLRSDHPTEGKSKT
jgi:hypothetical protein